MNPNPTPWQDAAAFLLKPAWYTPVFWLLLILSAVIAVATWRRDPLQRSGRMAGFWLLRVLTGCMWWEQSLWKIPFDYAGLIYWMKQQVEHAAVPLQGWLVEQVVLPNINLFGPLVYAWETSIGVSLILGLLSRWGALLGLGMALNLWLGLYSAPGEWPWTYFFLVIIQAIFVLEPPGQYLGADTWLKRS